MLLGPKSPEKFCEKNFRKILGPSYFNRKITHPLISTFFNLPISLFWGSNNGQKSLIQNCYKIENSKKILVARSI